MRNLSEAKHNYYPRRIRSVAPRSLHAIPLIRPLRPCGVEFQRIDSHDCTADHTAAARIVIHCSVCITIRIVSSNLEQSEQHISKESTAFEVTIIGEPQSATTLKALVVGCERHIREPSGVQLGGL